ncbi:MAG: SGNH/GDSL hydrolase family protein [Candidatus Nanopelagicales bacterium]
MSFDRTIRTALVATVLALAGGVLVAPATAAERTVAAGSSTAAETPRVLTDDCADGRVGRRVLVVGDSITVLSQATLERALGRAGWSVCVDARRGETTRGALDNYAEAAAFPAYVDVVVMATGTNDWADPSGFVAQVARARAYATGRPLLWVTTWLHPTRFTGRAADRALAAARRVNAVIWKHVERARRGTVVDWYAELSAGRGRPRALLYDGVHPTELGGRQRSALVAAALGRLVR